jgi:hypothetical protein
LSWACTYVNTRYNGAEVFMKVKFRKYQPERDFLKVRDMLVETFRQFEKPINWTFERWNYARYFAAPMLGAYGLTENTTEKSMEAIGLWEKAVGIWENEESKTVAVVCPDEHVPTHPSYGLAYFQRRPGYDDLHQQQYSPRIYSGSR